MVSQVKKMTAPVMKFRAGQISCAVWENQARVNGREITLLKATLDRRYKVSSGEWKSSGSFSRNEIPLAIHCLQKAFEAMIDEGNAKANGNIEEETVM